MTKNDTVFLLNINPIIIKLQRKNWIWKLAEYFFFLINVPTLHEDFLSLYPIATLGIFFRQ